MMTWRLLNKRRKLLLKWMLLAVLSAGAISTGIAALRRPQQQYVQAAGAKIEGLTSVLTKTAGGAIVPICFEDITDRSGLHFRHFPTQRESLLPEDMGSGVAVGDYDGDGWDDLFFVNFA